MEIETARNAFGGENIPRTLRMDYKQFASYSQTNILRTYWWETCARNFAALSSLILVGLGF